MIAVTGTSRDVVTTVRRAADEPVVAAVEDLAKTFGATRALRGVRLDVREGEVHALIGHNGAGKSTVVKILAGALKPDSGRVTIGGEPMKPSPASALQLGVRCIYQERTLFPNCSVAENIAMLRRGKAWYSAAHARRIARARLELLGCTLDVRRRAGSLSIGEAQEVDIARALDERCRLLILDEPTSSLSAREVQRLLEVMEQARTFGVGMLFVSHELDVVQRIADRITILRDGAVAAQGRATAFSKSDLVEHMLGATHELERAAQLAAHNRHVTELAMAGADGPPALVLRGVASGRLGSTDLELHAGEVVGVTGSLGSGVEDLARVLAGLVQPGTGELEVRGRAVRLRSPRHALRLGIAYVPDDRHRKGVFGNLLPVRQIGLSKMILSRRVFLEPGTERRDALRVAGSVGLSDRDAQRFPSTLSGGNQQKVMLARCLATRPSVLVAHEPTVGVDVGSRAATHGLLRALAEDGVAVVLISSDADEIVEVADRAVVVRRGRVVLDARRFDESRIVRETLGASSGESIGIPSPKR
jgi:rhamnose transport system ATP-binding protein